MSSSEQILGLKSKNYIPKDVTNIIKGVALIFMFILHFFAHPEWYIFSVSYGFSDLFSKYFLGPLGLCVAIFAFLTGYFYTFCKNKSFKYSVDKATDLWINYFVTFIILMLVSVALGCWESSFSDFILESFGLYRPTMIFGWYVDFYIVSILILPFIYKILSKDILVACTTGIFIPLIISSLIGIYGYLIPNEYIVDLLSNFYLWFPCIASGVIFAEYDLFYGVFDRIFSNNIKSNFVKVIVWSVLLLISFFGKYFSPEFSYIFGFELDFIYAPIFVYALINLVNMISNYNKWLYPFSIIGKYSLSMWFIHCVFFNTCKQYTQSILYWPNNPILVVVWGIVICLIPSIIINCLINWIVGKKKLLVKGV